MITPVNAYKLALWTAHEHPELFRRLVAMTTRQRVALGSLGCPPQGTQGTQRMATVGRMGGLGYHRPFSVESDNQRFAIRGRYGYLVDPHFMGGLRPGGMGYFGQDDIPEITVSADAVPPVDVSMPEPTLTDVTSSLDIPSAPVDLPSEVLAAGTTGGFWSTVGNDLASGGSAVLGAVAGVAKSLTDPTTLQAAGTVAASYFKAQGQTAAAQGQAAIYNAQLQRTMAGGGPAAIAYQRDPITGQTVPVYYSGTRRQVVTPSLLSSLSAGPGWVPFALVGGGILVLAMLLSSRRGSRT